MIEFSFGKSDKYNNAQEALWSILNYPDECFVYFGGKKIKLKWKTFAQKALHTSIRLCLVNLYDKIPKDINPHIMKWLQTGYIHRDLMLKFNMDIDVSLETAISNAICGASHNDSALASSAVGYARWAAKTFRTNYPCIPFNSHLYASALYLRADHSNVDLRTLLEYDRSLRHEDDEDDPLSEYWRRVVLCESPHAEMLENLGWKREPILGGGVGELVIQR